MNLDWDSVPPLYHYFADKKHFDEFFDDGGLWITTLEKCRNHEGIRKDSEEGYVIKETKTDSKGRANIDNFKRKVVDEDGRPLSDVSVVLIHDVKNCFLFCMSSNPHHFDRFGSKWALKISKPKEFLTAVLDNLSNENQMLMKFGPILYAEDESVPSHLYKDALNLIFFKSSSFKIEDEWRAGFFPDVKAKQDLENLKPYKIQCLQATQYCEKFLQESIKNISWVKKADLLLFRGHFKEALECYDKIAEPDLDTYNKKGIACSRMDQHEMALEYYNQALRFKEDALVYNNKGNSLKQLGQHNDALACYNRSLKLNPKYTDAYFNRGVLLTSMGCYEEAIPCYTELLKFKSNHEAYNNKGLLLQRLNRHNDAIACFDEALKIKCVFGVHSNKGISLTKLRQYKEAEEYYDAAIRLNPRYIGGYNNKFFLYMDLGRLEDALKCCDDALDIEPNNAWILLNKGDLFAILKQYEAAIECYDRVLAIRQDPVAYNNKSHVLCMLGRYNEALECVDNALEMNPNYTQALKNREIIVQKLAHYQR